MNKKNEPKKTIIVCSKCFRASCWLGVFRCEDALGADPMEVEVNVLEILELENPEFWDKEKK